jgi:methylation protein EvaC
VCGGCGSARVTEFLDLGTSPLADRFPASLDDPEAWWPLGLQVCEDCWLVQLTEVVPDDQLWGADYGFYTGSSPAAVAYFQEYADWLLAPANKQATDGLVVEVACNDGTLLGELHTAGCRTLGVEPSSGPADVARGRGLDVVGEPFGLAVAERIREGHGPAGLVIANNVAAHVADLGDFFAGIRYLLVGDGIAVIEVQYLADLLLGNGFDHVYHEHRTFFSVSTLAETMTANGLELTGWSRTPAQGGSIRVTARRTRYCPQVPPREEWLCHSGTYSEVQGRADMLRERICGLVDAELDDGRIVVGYGASAKSCTILNWCGLGPKKVAAVHDLTPTKVGKFTPGTHIPITDAPLPEGATALMLIHNYLGPVIRREREWLDSGGRFIVPIPVPVLL